MHKYIRAAALASCAPVSPTLGRTTSRIALTLLQGTLMAITTMTAMWELLDAYTLTPEGKERPVNQNNEWGGFSRRLRMPVFTGWFDMTTFDKVNKTTSAVVCDTAWTGRPVGLPNQERWVRHAETENDGVAAFFI